MPNSIVMQLSERILIGADRSKDSALRHGEPLLSQVLLNPGSYGFCINGPRITLRATICGQPVHCCITKPRLGSHSLKPSDATPTIRMSPPRRSPPCRSATVPTRASRPSGKSGEAGTETWDRRRQTARPDHARNNIGACRNMNAKQRMRKTGWCT